MMQSGSPIISAVASIVLAGGKGVRMKSDLPKVLHPFLGKPLIAHVIGKLQKAGVSDIFVIVGYRGELVIDAIKDLAIPIWQKQQLGTGHAVMQAEDALAGFSGRIIIACGDVPLVRPETFRSLIADSEDQAVKAVVLTMNLENPSGYGRIVKDSSGNFLRVVEEKDASPDEKKIHEVNTGTCIFDKRLLFEGLRGINTNNAQGEYYLPDALQHIRSSGYTVKTKLLENPREGSGVNTKEELKELEDYFRQTEKDTSAWAIVC
jgi:bifunctional UDP-N-acetylglucosamine pyrophosphorylase/glucosamine-1-phosphate N-acetyltransferase